MDSQSKSPSPLPYIVDSRTLCASPVCVHCEKVKSAVQQAFQQALQSSSCIRKGGGCCKNKLSFQLPKSRLKLKWHYECLCCDFKSFYKSDVEKHAVRHSDQQVFDVSIESSDDFENGFRGIYMSLSTLDTPKKSEKNDDYRGGGKQDQSPGACPVFSIDASIQSDLAQSKHTQSSSTVIAVPNIPPDSGAPLVTQNESGDHTLRSPQTAIDLSKFSDLLGLKKVAQSCQEKDSKLTTAEVQHSTVQLQALVTSDDKNVATIDRQVAARHPVVVLSPLTQTGKKPTKATARKSTSAQNKAVKATARKTTPAPKKVPSRKRPPKRFAPRKKKRSPSATADTSKPETTKSALSVFATTNTSGTLTGVNWHSPEPQQNVACPAPGFPILQNLLTPKLSPLHVSTDLPPRPASKPCENESTSEEEDGNPWPSPNDQEISVDISPSPVSKHKSTARKRAFEHALTTPLLTFGRPLFTPLSTAPLSTASLSTASLSPNMSVSTPLGLNSFPFKVAKKAAVHAVSTLKKPGSPRKNNDILSSPVTQLEENSKGNGGIETTIRYVPNNATVKIKRRSRYIPETNPYCKSNGYETDDEEDVGANAWPGPILSDEEFRDQSLVSENGTNLENLTENKSKPLNLSPTPEKKRRKLA